MALTTLSELPAYDRPFPKIGCGLNFCFEEDDFEITPGTESDIELVIELFGALTDGDTMNLYGYAFTFVSAVPTNLQQIQIAGGAGTATNLYNSLIQIPFFIDNYTIDNSVAFQVKLTNLVAELDPYYFFSYTTVNANAVIIDPFSTPTAGINAVYKDGYYVYYDLFDTDTSERLCSVPVFKPLNLLSSGDAKVCFDVQPVIARYPELYTAPPLPRQPTYQGVNRPDNFDANYIRKFRLRVWNSYKDPDSTENCARVQSNLIEIPTVPGLTLEVANFIEKETTCNGNGFFDYSFPPLVALTQKYITVMPETYKLCQNTAFEFRFDYDVATINALGGDVYMQLTINFTDGTSLNNITQWDRSFNGVHVANISFGSIGSNATIQLSAPFDSKTISSVDISIFHVLFAISYFYMEPKTVYFDIGINHKVSCCEGLQTFYFLSTVGNNDLILGKTIESEREVEFDTFCREQICCGADYYGTHQYNTGKVNANLKETAKVHKAVIEASGDYLDEFLLSPFKWLYEPETDSLFAIRGTEGSFKIYQKNFRNIIEFTYQKTLIEKHFQL